MVKLAICDDEKVSREKLSVLLQDYSRERNTPNSVSSFAAASPVLDCSERFDIYLLDILMPGLSGMELAEDLRRKDETACLIFLTSSPEFALESYSVRAFDYILKPVDRERLYKTLDHALSFRAKQISDELIVRSGGRLISVPLGSIEYVEARQEKLVYYLNGNRILEAPGVLASLESRLLADPRFIKPHRAYIVSMDYIRSLEGRELTVVGSFPPVPIARGHFAEIRKAYLGYMTFSMEKHSGGHSVQTKTAGTNDAGRNGAGMTGKDAAGVNGVKMAGMDDAGRNDTAAAGMDDASSSEGSPAGFSRERGDRP